MLPMRVSVRQPDGTTITYIPVVTEAEMQQLAILRGTDDEPDLNDLPPPLPSRQDIPTAHALTYSRSKSRSTKAQTDPDSQPQPQPQQPQPPQPRKVEEKEEESSEEEEGPAINVYDLHKGGEKQIIRPSDQVHFVPPGPPTLDVSPGLRFEHKKKETKKTKTQTRTIYDEGGSGARNIEQEVNEIVKTKAAVDIL